MATVIQGKPSAGRQNTSAITGALGDALKSGWESYVQQHDQSALQSAVSGLPKDASPRDILDAVTAARTYSPQAKQAAIINYLGAAKQEEQSRHARSQEQISRSKPSGSSSVQLTPEEREKQKARLVAEGYTENQAERFLDSTPGVKSQIERDFQDRASHGQLPSQQPREAAAMQPVQEAQEQSAQQAPQQAAQELAPAEPEAPVSKRKEWPDLPGPENRSPKEATKWRDNNKAVNTKRFQEIQKDKAAAESSMVSLGQLKQIQERGNLPSGVARLVMLDKDTGELRPAVGLTGKQHKDVDLWSKIVNQYVRGAKQMFGGRVTNYDVQVFLKGLPSLMNSSEGRRAIIEMMKVNEQMNLLKADTWDKGLKAYGDKASYIDIAGAVDEKVQPEMSRLTAKASSLIQATDKLDERDKDPKKYAASTLMVSPSGKMGWVPTKKLGEYLEKGFQQW